MINISKNILNDLNTIEDLYFQPRYLDFTLWENFLNQIEYTPYLYTNSSIEYQEEYRRFNLSWYLDLSSVIKYKGSNIGLIPLGICKINGNYKIFSQTNFNGLNEPPPLNKPIFMKNFSEKIIKKISLEIQRILSKISRIMLIKEWQTSDFFDGNNSISQWHLLSMEMGAEVNLIHELYVNLDLSLLEIKSKFRKSYKSLIKEEKIKLKTFVMNKNDQEIWDQFKKAHFISAGRITRSDKSWLDHFMDIDNNCGLLVYIKNHEDLFLGGGFFNFSKDEAVYSVAAYDRNFFHLPLGHIVQYRAIKEFKKKGLKWYRIGHLPFLGDEIVPSEKYLNIGNFKKGFATDIVPKYIFKHKNQFI